MDSWRALPERNLFFRGMSVWIGFPHARLRFSVPERQAGHSQWNLRSLTHLALSALTAYSSAPLRLVGVVALLFGLFALLLGLHTLYNYLAGNAVSGFTTIILLLLILGAALLTGLSIIGEYIARIYDETKQRPRYVVRSEAGFDPGGTCE